MGMESSTKSAMLELEGLDPDSYGGAAGFVEKEKVKEKVKGGFWYSGVNPTVDMVVIKNRQVLHIKRGGAGAESGRWALPGGFIDTQASRGQKWEPGVETPRQAALRELTEETNLKLFGCLKNLSSRLVEVGVFEGGGRDPRDSEVAWSRSHAFALRLLDSDSVNFSQIRGMDDALEARWVGLDNLPPMAFDHGKILSEALVKLSEFEKKGSRNRSSEGPFMS
jgi:ADP-ribose pyrophosphatase YjhB (NUDIX family)